MLPTQPPGDQRSISPFFCLWAEHWYLVLFFNYTILVMKKISKHHLALLHNTIVIFQALFAMIFELSNIFAFLCMIIWLIHHLSSIKYFTSYTEADVSLKWKILRILDLLETFQGLWSCLAADETILRTHSAELSWNFMQLITEMTPQTRPWPCETVTRRLSITVRRPASFVI